MSSFALSLIFPTFQAFIANIIHIHAHIPLLYVHRLELSAGDPRAPYKEYSQTEQKLLDSPFAASYMKQVMRNLGYSDDVLHPHLRMTPAQRMKMIEKRKAKETELGVQASTRSRAIKSRVIAKKR
jgi:hypothetical protein